MLCILKSKEKIFQNISYIFLCILTIYAILREIIPLEHIIGSQILSTAMFFLCLFFLAINIFSNPKHFKFKNSLFFIFFICSAVISILLNFNFSFVSNIKALLWMIVFLLYIYPQGYHIMSKDTNKLNTYMKIIIATMSFLVFVSIIMFFWDVDYEFNKTTGAFTNQGFSNQYVRLWGVFQEANYAAVYSSIALFMSIYSFFQNKNKLTRIWLITCSVLFFVFIILSGSRTALLSNLVAFVWFVFYKQINKKGKNSFKKTAYALFSAILSVVVLFGAYTTIKFVLPYSKLFV